MKTSTLIAATAALGLALLLPAPAAAADCDNPKKASGSLSESTYRQMTRIQEDIGESKYADAIKSLDRLVNRVKNNDYEYALVMQTYGFAYSAQEQYSKAADAFQAAIDKDALPQEPQELMLFNIGQLYLAGDEPDKGLKYLLRYVNTACSKVPPEAYILIANAYAEKKQFSKALPWIDKAIAGKGAKTPESWYQLKLASHYELRQFKSAAQVLVTLISKYPIKEQYWKQLSGVFQELKDDEESLAVMALAERQGFLDTEKELSNLANIYLFMDIPYKAAKVMDRAMAEGKMERNYENLKKLGTAWQLARVDDKAIEVLSQAAEAGRDGDMWMQIGQIYVDQEKWNKAIDNLNKAVEQGASRSGEANLLLGVSHWNKGDKSRATAAFKKAQRFDKTKKQAATWLAHLSTQG
ncbi:tetratricopeptide repeat protein [bacterium]|nr:tetratricopeptide repeat protein [bacterium]